MFRRLQLCFRTGAGAMVRSPKMRFVCVGIPVLVIKSFVDICTETAASPSSYVLSLRCTVMTQVPCDNVESSDDDWLAGSADTPLTKVRKVAPSHSPCASSQASPSKEDRMMVQCMQAWDGAFDEETDLVLKTWKPMFLEGLKTIELFRGKQLRPFAVASHCTGANAFVRDLRLPF